VGAELGRVIGELARELIGEERGDDAVCFKPPNWLGKRADADHWERFWTVGGSGVLERAELARVDAGETVWKVAGELFWGIGDVVLAEPVEPRVDAKKADTNLEALRGRPRAAPWSWVFNGSELAPFMESSGVSSEVISGSSCDRSSNNSGSQGIWSRAATISC